jgi:hypothetical protein
MTPIEYVLLGIAATVLYWLIAGVVMIYRVVTGHPVPPLFEDEQQTEHHDSGRPEMPWGDEYD